MYFPNSRRVHSTPVSWHRYSNHWHPYYGPPSHSFLMYCIGSLNYIHTHIYFNKYSTVLCKLVIWIPYCYGRVVKAWVSLIHSLGRNANYCSGLEGREERFLKGKTQQIGWDVREGQNRNSTLNRVKTVTQWSIIKPLGQESVLFQGSVDPLRGFMMNFSLSQALKKYSNTVKIRAF